MIKIVDRLRYQPKSLENDITNTLQKGMVERIRNKAKRIKTEGKVITVTLTGTYKKLKFSISPSDDQELVDRIQQALTR